MKMQIRMILLLLTVCLIIVPASADYDFDGFDLITTEHGIVNGEIYVGGGHGLPLTANNNNVHTQGFTIPDGTVKSSQLYVGVWGGKETYSGELNTVFNGNDLGTLTLEGISDTNPNVWCAGHGVYWVKYDVTAITNNGINSATATTNKISTGFDGRMYGIILVAVVENSEKSQVEYWINDGHWNLNYVSPFDSDATQFSGLLTDPNNVNAKLTTVYLTGDVDEGDTLQFNANTVNDAADGCGSDERGNSWCAAFDIDTWDFESTSLDAQDIRATFNRGNDAYLHPVMAILEVKSGQDVGPAPMVEVSINEVSVESGNDITVPIMFNDITNYGTGTIKVTYDPAITEVTGVEGSADSTISASNIDNDAGSVTISAWNLNGKSGDVVFADITFQAVASSGSSSLILEVETLQDTLYNEIPNTINHGTISIIDSTEPHNGYSGDKPLTIFSHDTIVGNLTYSTGSSYYSGKMFTDDTYEVEHNVLIPEGATVKFARLYLYWTWSAMGTTGLDPDLILTLDGDERSPDIKYNDSKGSEPYNYPSGTWAYDVTDHVTGSGDYTSRIVNTGPDGSYFAVDGLGLLVVYTDPNEDEIEYWITEGCDMLSSQIESKLTPEEATTQAVFSGSIDPTNIKEAKLTTVVQSGNNIDNMLIFNVKNWTGIYDGTPYVDLDVDEQDVLNHLVYTDNIVKIRAVDDYMVPGNAFLVLKHINPEPAEPPEHKTGGKVSMMVNIIPAISIKVTPSNVNFGSLGPGEISTKKEIIIKNKGATTIKVTSEATDTAQNLYVKGLLINDALWSDYQTQLMPSSTQEADLQLKVPVDYAGVGEKEGVLTIWAQKG